MRHSLTASLFAAGLLLGSGVAASAADMAVKAPPPVAVYDWTGWYGGVNVGYSWGHSTTTTTPNDPALAGIVATQRVDHRGWEASVEGGYCWQRPATVYVACLEARYDFPRERSSTSTTGIPGTTTNIYSTTNVDPILIGPHLGVLTDANHTMWYGAGGLAVGEVDGSATANDGVGGISTANPGSKWSAGWFLGAGIEHMVDRNWSVKVEYDYVRLGGGGSTAYYAGTNLQTNATFRGVPIQPPGSATIGGHAFDNVVSVGINYHLH